MYERILVPTDGSKEAGSAVDHATDIARTYDAALHTIYAVNTSVDTTTPGTLDALKEAGETAVDEVVQRAEAAGVGTVEGVVAQGAPHRAILDYADEHDIDMIVMGTHGRTGLPRYLLGSVTEKIVRLSDAPVLTVRRAESSETPS